MKIILSLSGGMDSTTLLAKALYEKHDVIVVSFRYGSRHEMQEGAAAARVASYYNVPYTTLGLTSLLQSSKSALSNLEKPLPQGHFQDCTMRQTVVPGRNLLFLSILASIAENENANEIWYGAHAGDHFIYPDCRPDFVYAVDDAVYSSTDYKVRVQAPFMDMYKKGILLLGNELKVPYYLTRTCYSDKVVACGKCGSCQERLAAFAEIGIEDPLPYESRELISRSKE